jgi:arginase family enzyme
MAILQMLAARLAGIDGLVYHSIDTDGLDAYAEAVKTESRFGAVNQVADVVAEILKLGFSWGTSDGN